MFCCTLLYVLSSIAIILMGKRELVALLNLSSWCLVMVVWLFLAVPRGCLQFVIVVFPDHAHLLFLKTYLLMRWYGPDVLAVCQPAGWGLHVACWISFVPIFSFIYCLVLIFAIISFLYLELYFLGDDALNSYGSFMQTKHLCVLIHI